jgi:TatD DNase family protein
VIDTHCHLTFDDYAGQVDAVLSRARAAGVRGAITISTTTENCLNCLALAESHENLWCTAGIHPLYSDSLPRNWENLRRVALHPKCVAWGELGLDHHYDRPPRAMQRNVLDEQLAFIESCRGDGIDKPIVVHCRKAVDDLLDVFRRVPALEPSRFVFHCFTESPDEARKVLDFGAWISFTGVVTFKNAPEVAESAKLVPLDRIMVETDSPFLSPEPVRKIRPNEPQFVVHVAKFLAQLRGVDSLAMERILDANAQQFFGIDASEAPAQPG